MESVGHKFLPSPLLTTFLSHICTMKNLISIRIFHGCNKLEPDLKQMDLKFVLGLKIASHNLQPGFFNLPDKRIGECCFTAVKGVHFKSWIVS